MNLIPYLKELWYRRVLVGIVALIAALVAVTVVYNVSISPPGLHKRDQVEAHGSIEILIDSAKSPIADVGKELEPLTARAGVFARYIAGGIVIDRIAEKTGIPPKQIEVAGPLPLPGEAPGVASAPEEPLPYGIEIQQRDELPIVNVVTRAPTLSEAGELADAVPPAIRQIVSRIQQNQEIPDSKRVTFRVLGPAQVALSNEAKGAKVALVIFFVFFALGLLAILCIPRLIDAWRAADSDLPKQKKLEVASALPPGETDDQVAAPHALAHAERAQLEMRRPGDG
jgi:hypothetical protein